MGKGGDVVVVEEFAGEDILPAETGVGELGEGVAEGGCACFCRGVGYHLRFEVLWEQFLNRGWWSGTYLKGR